MIPKSQETLMTSLHVTVRDITTMNRGEGVLNEPITQLGCFDKARLEQLLFSFFFKATLK